MKKVFFCGLLVFLLASNICMAGTFENGDSYPYDYEVTTGGKTLKGTIYGDSIMYGFCDGGCRLTLLKSGQTIYLNPDDHIIIDRGSMRLKPAD